MTPKDKADDLVHQVYRIIFKVYPKNWHHHHSEEAKEIATIFVDEFIAESDAHAWERIEYWEQVKEEIQNM